MPAQSEQQRRVLVERQVPERQPGQRPVSLREREQPALLQAREQRASPPERQVPERQASPQEPDSAQERE